MTTWILLLMLVGPDGHGLALESVPGFATREACNDAGVSARGLPVLTPPAKVPVPGGRVDWVCFSTGSTTMTIEDRARARQQIADALREDIGRNREAFEAGRQ